MNKIFTLGVDLARNVFQAKTKACLSGCCPYPLHVGAISGNVAQVFKVMYGSHTVVCGFANFTVSYGIAVPAKYFMTRYSALLRPPKLDHAIAVHFILLHLVPLHSDYDSLDVGLDRFGPSYRALARLRTSS